MDAAKAFQEKPASVSRESTAPEVRKQAVPLYKKNPRPRYPRIARRRGHTGTVMLMVFVNKIGEAEKLRIFESSGYDSLDHAAETAVADWRFEPGTSNGVPTGMWVKIPITFELKH
jgi:protein TonB